MRWFRSRGSSPGLDAHVLADTWQLVSLLLDYPYESLVGRVPVLRSVLGLETQAEKADGIPAAGGDP